MSENWPIALEEVMKCIKQEHGPGDPWNLLRNNGDFSTKIPFKVDLLEAFYHLRLRAHLGSSNSSIIILSKGSTKPQDMTISSNTNISASSNIKDISNLISMPILIKIMANTNTTVCREICLLGTVFLHKETPIVSRGPPPHRDRDMTFVPTINHLDDKVIVVLCHNSSNAQKRLTWVH
jgi:hypothetical protein